MFVRLRNISIGVAALSLLLIPTAHASSAKSVKGAQGQILKVSQSTVKDKTKVIITGSGFDESVGIYVGFCVLPAKGEVPTPCGGGINKTGAGESSYWISSNPPPYGVGVADPFLPTGAFKVSIILTKKIANFNCTKVKCAITVRADHLRGSDRSFDLFIPIIFKK